MNDNRPTLFDSRAFAAAWVVAGILLALWPVLAVARNENHHEDLWIYTSGAALSFAGQSPYSTDHIRERFTEQYPPEESPRNKTLRDNCGYFLAPQAMLVFAPALPFPWPLAKVLWCLSTVALGALAGWLLLPAFGVRAPFSLRGIAAFVVLCNPMSVFALVLGQTSLYVFACVVFGQCLYRAGWPVVGNLVWALAFIKPHLALPLLLFALVSDGWRRAFGVAAWVLLLNVLAGLASTGDPLILREYVRYLEDGHMAVVFNRVATNTDVSSWNRLMVSAGGPVVELGAAGTLAGYAVWFGLCAMRTRWLGGIPGSAWMLAAVGVGIPLCCQTLPYELPVLVLMLPWVVETSQRKRIAVPMLTLLFATEGLLLGGPGSTIEMLAKLFGSPFIERLFDSHQSLFVALCALLVLAFPISNHPGEPGA